MIHNKVIQVVLLCCVLFVHQATTCQQTVHVSVDGDDITGDGTDLNPYATITYVITNNLVCTGGLLKVERGRYSITGGLVTSLSSVTLQAIPNDVYIRGLIGILGGSLDWVGFSFEEPNITITNANVTFTDCIFAGHQGGYGDCAITTTNTIISCNHCTFTNNTCSISMIDTALAVFNSNFTQNSGNGVIVGVGGLVEVANTSFTNNLLELRDSILQCQATTYTYAGDTMTCGGAVLQLINASSLTVVDSIFDTNSVYDYRTIGPPATVAGGGLLIVNISHVEFSNCYFTKNVISNYKSAVIAGGQSGGIMYISFAAEYIDGGFFHNCTFYNNAAPVSIPSQIAIASVGTIATANFSIFSCTFSLANTPAIQLTYIYKLLAVNSSFLDSTGITDPMGFKTDSYSMLVVDYCYFSGLSAAIQDSGSTYIYNSIFEKNGGVLLGLVYSTGPTLVIDNTIFRNNSGSGVLRNGFSGLLGLPSNSYMRNVSFTNNFGLAAQVVSEGMVFEDCEFIGNVYSSNGAAISLSGSPSTFTRCLFLNNTSTGGGSAIYITNSGGSTITYVTITNSTFYYNSGYMGGSIYANGAALVVSITNSILSDSLASSTGGTMYMNNAVPIITNCTILNSLAYADGGSIYIITSSSAGAYTGWINDTIITNSNAPALDSIGGAIVISLSGVLSAELQQTITLNDVTLMYNHADVGGAVAVQSADVFVTTYPGRVFIQNSEILYNNADEAGGALYTSSFTALTLHNTSIHDCIALNQGGAVYLNDGQINIIDSEIYNCQSTFGGGAILMTGTTTNANFGGIYRSVLRNNTSLLGAGGAISISMAESDTFYVINSTIIGNSASSNGGAVMVSTYAKPYFENSILSSNTAFQGGGIYCDVLSAPMFTATTFANNTAISDGGGVGIAGTSKPVFTGCEFVANSGASGGAVSVLSYSAPQFLDCVFTENESSFGSGGAVYATSSTSGYPLFINSTFYNNYAQNGGGFASSLSSTASFNSCLFEANSASVGGALHISGNAQPKIIMSLFRNNTAETYGGGVYCDAQSTIQISDSKIFGNTGTLGGGICGYENCVPTITTTHVASNTASSYGGGLYMAANNFAVMGTTFEENSGTYGGGIYMANSMSNGQSFSNNSFVACKASVAGGGFFWDVTTSIGGGIGGGRGSVSYTPPACSNCSFAENVAGYGPNYATKAASQSFLSVPSTLAFVNGQFGPVIIVALDYYGQLANESSSTTTTTIGGGGFNSNSLSSRVELRTPSSDVYGAITQGQQGTVKEGTVTYTVISIDGFFDYNYTLSFTLQGSVLGGSSVGSSLTLNVTYYPCSIGHC